MASRQIYLHLILKKFKNYRDGESCNILTSGNYLIHIYRLDHIYIFTGISIIKFFKIPSSVTYM